MLDTEKARLNGSRKKRSFSSLTEPVFEAHEQTETVLDAQELTEPILHLGEQTAPVLDLGEQNEPLGRAVGRPSGFGKKRKSINKLCALEVEKQKKPSGKKRQNK